MDIGRLEEWRINKDMLKEDLVTSNPESSESTPVIKPHLEGNENPAVNGLDKLEELPISSEERAAESEEDDFVAIRPVGIRPRDLWHCNTLRRLMRRLIH